MSEDEKTSENAEDLRAELRVANELIANLYRRIGNLEASVDARIKALYRKFEGGEP